MALKVYLYANITRISTTYMCKHILPVICIQKQVISEEIKLLDRIEETLRSESLSHYSVSYAMLESDNDKIRKHTYNKREKCSSN